MSTPLPDEIFVALQRALAGRYSLERELGRGGMGIVYLARDVRLDRPVALKLLPPDRAAIATIRQRFLTEARMAARLSHPNIVPIHAVEEIGGHVFFAMQYVAGETLGDRIRRLGRLAPWDAAQLLRDVAWALAYAHAQGVIHRDIKPDNILLDHQDRALVADFGIATLADADNAEGRIQGTPEYLAPEQAGGHGCDGRADLYALGAVGFHALKGHPPFAGDTAALLSQHLTQPAPSLVATADELPPRLAAAIDRALLKSPGDRWASAEAMAEALAPPLPITTDLPVPVRIWAERGREMKGLYVVWSLMFYGLATFIGTFASIAGWPLEAIVVFGFFVAAIPVPWIGHAFWRLVETRKALEAGATVEDLRHAAEVTRARREEELRFDSTRPIHWLPTLMRRMTYGAFGVAVTALIAGMVIPATAVNSYILFWIFALSTLMGISGAMKGLLMPGRRVKAVDPWARARVWFWQGAIGRLFARAAATGLPVREAGWAPWRPTEAALGGVTATLFDALPANKQRALAGLPDVVARLEHEAAHARRQLESGAGEGHWPARLSAAVGAIETLRLGLLRMHAHREEPGALTADLDAARLIAERIDYLVAAEDEIAGLLDQPSQSDIHAPPSASAPSTSLG